MYELIADRAFNKPLLVTPARLDVISAVLLQRMGLHVPQPVEPDDTGLNAEQPARPHMYQVPDSAEYKRDGGYYVDGGVGILNVFGTMVHRGGFLDAMSGITSYDAISRRIDRIGNDPQVRAVIGNFDTPGGEVAGAFDVAEKWRRLSQAKPTHALVAEMAASAGYLIASGSTRIHTTQTGYVGSIGVVMKHIDFSRWNEAMGVNPTYIFAGDRKVDGNPEQPLPEDVRARFQEEIDAVYSMFVAAVERGRAIDAQAIIDTQAASYMGEAGLAAGLADAVTNGDELLELVKQEATRRIGTNTTMANTEEIPMPECNTETNDKNIVVSINAVGIDQAAVLAAVSGAIEGADVQLVEPGAEIEGEATEITPEAALAIQQEAAAEAATNERERIAAILSSDAASTRMETAITLATETDLEADKAVATLEKLPANIKGKSRLEEAMAAAGTPGIGSEESAGDLDDSQKILGSYRAATGRQPAATTA